MAGGDGAEVVPDEAPDQGQPVPCGYLDQGYVLRVAEGIELCLPPVVCTPDTCPPGLGTCVDGACAFEPGYRGLETLPEAWVTHYCDLAQGECEGVSQFNDPRVTAGLVADGLGQPLCDAGVAADQTCVGVVASPPMMVGNSELAIDAATGRPVATWGLGLTEASGLCYQLTGPGGTVVAALTNRCGGWCTCGGSEIQECGACVNAPDLRPNCSCVGDVPGLQSACCGRECTTTDALCDWCASDSHPHFDLDTAAFEHVCGPLAELGSCLLSAAQFVPCLPPNPRWPPGGASCLADEGMFYCQGSSPDPEHQAVVPQSPCCCNWGLTVDADGRCSAPSP